MADVPEPLPGNVGGAIRIGGTVLRPTGPWTPAVHALLGHLAATGLRGVPRVLGLDGEREVLEFLPGRSIAPDAELPTDAELGGAAAWLRDYHAAVASFRPTAALHWRGEAEPVVLGADRIVTHNDPGTYNWVVDGGDFVGMIDWDMAGPGHPIDDLAFLCWTAVPLVRATPPAEAAHRLRVVLGAYGRFTPDAVLDAADERMRTAAARIAAGQRRSDPGFLRLAEVGEPARTLAAVDAFLARRPELEAALTAG